jgi:hypothetical protein
LSSEELLELVRNPSKVESDLPWGEVDEFMADLGLVRDEYKCPKLHVWFHFVTWKKNLLDEEKENLYYDLEDLIGDRLEKVRNYRGTILAYRCNKEVAWLSAKKRKQLESLLKKVKLDPIKDGLKRRQKNK